MRPSAVVVDSIQTVYLDEIPSSAGSITQVCCHDYFWLRTCRCRRGISGHWLMLDVSKCCQLFLAVALVSLPHPVRASLPSWLVPTHPFPLPGPRVCYGAAPGGKARAHPCIPGRPRHQEWRHCWPPCAGAHCGCGGLHGGGTGPPAGEGRICMRACLGWACLARLDPLGTGHMGMVTCTYPHTKPLQGGALVSLSVVLPPLHLPLTVLCRCAWCEQ
jgi:hypothetical protein